MNKTEDELAEIMHLFYVKHELTNAGISYHGLSSSGILELYNTFFGSRYTPRREGEQRSRRIKSNAKNESKPEDEATHSGNGIDVDQSANPGNGSVVDQSKRKEKNGSHIDNSVDVFSSVPNDLVPLEPAPITPRYSAPPYCNKEYNYATREEKQDHLANYHFMLKMEKEYNQSLSKHQVSCGSPIPSKVRKVNPNANLIKSFKGILTDLTYFKQQNEYQTYIFSVNPNNFEPKPQSSNQPDNIEDNGNDNRVDNVIPSAGNFGLNDLLNLAVIDDPPAHLSSWIDRQISASPHSLPPRQYRYESDHQEAGPSRKRSRSPEDKNVKRNKVSETSTVSQRVQDSVRVEAGPSNIVVAVPGTSRGTTYSSNSLADESFPYFICELCHHWYEANPMTNHWCASPIYSGSE